MARIQKGCWVLDITIAKGTMSITLPYPRDVIRFLSGCGYNDAVRAVSARQTVISVHGPVAFQLRWDKDGERVIETKKDAPNCADAESDPQ